MTAVESHLSGELVSIRVECCLEVDCDCNNEGRAAAIRIGSFMFDSALRRDLVRYCVVMKFELQ